MLCLVLGYVIIYGIYMINSAVVFKVGSVAVGQSYDFPGAGEIIMKDINRWLSARLQ